MAKGGGHTQVVTVTVSTNDCSWLDACLSTLTASVFAGYTDLHVLVVDKTLAEQGRGQLARENIDGIAGPSLSGCDTPLDWGWLAGGH